MSRDKGQTTVFLLGKPWSVPYFSLESARGHGFVKDRFIIDLGDKALTDKLRGQLAQYNIRNPDNRVRSLWVMSRGELIEIVLIDRQ